MKKLLAIAASLFLLVSVAGCSTSVAPKDLFSQTPNWSVCEGGVFQCATVQVPVSWAEPKGETFGLALIRKVTNKSIGSLVLNPGGPGGSGYDFLKNNWADIGTNELRSAYTYVSFDPRGVSRSAGVKCLNSKDTDHLLYDSNNAELGSAEDLKIQRTEIKKFVAACERNTGAVLANLDTVSAAKDLEVIRGALGESKLNYLGFSYGTFLGTTYAALFPEKVGRFVLDGAIDPRVSDEQQSINQLSGFDIALNNYLKDCVDNNIDCPFKGNFWSAKAEVKQFLLKMEKKSLPTSTDRELTIASATTGLIMALYSDTYWPYLSHAFAEAKTVDGTTFLSLADFYNDRQGDGSYSGNSFEANVAINCLDSRASATPEAMAKQNARLLAAAPILGRYWQNGALLCDQWPYPVASRPDSYAAKGAPTILVVGTTGDPATPYEQSVDLAHQVLADGFLITFKGEGHTAYGRSNECVSSAVDGFLINGKIPSKEPVC